MSRDYRLYLDDMLSSCTKALSYAQDRSFDVFLADQMVVDAILLNLQVIGEAAGHLPEELRERYPDVPWRKIVGLRNVIAHDYFALDRRIIWETVQNDLPTLLSQLQRILADQS